MKIRFAIVSIGLVFLCGTLVSCSHEVISPNDAIKRVASITPDSVYVPVQTPTTFTADFPSLKSLGQYIIAWDADSVSSDMWNSTSFSLSFRSAGRHLIRAILKDPSHVSRDSASASALVTMIPIGLSTTAPSTVALSPVTFTATYNFFGGSTHLIWDFGDGTPTVDTTSNTITHGFAALGTIWVKASLFKDSILLGSDSISENVTAPPGLTLSAFSQFHRATTIFVGRGSWSAACYDAPPFSFTQDSLIWNENQFHHSTSHSTSSNSFDPNSHSSNSSSSRDNEGISGTVAMDAMSIDSAYAFYNYDESNITTNADGQRFGSSQGGAAALWINSLRLEFFTPDSARFSSVGPSTQYHVAPGAGCWWSDAKGSSQCRKQYEETDWNSKSPVPAVIVMFYRK
ncbi:MAG: hypothetical protein Q8922_07270 [Bacteroidota bacterium]|nr:hypothetical protein [Bacteroidota bacterium]MDP4233535.1 hypothetical protein [Bacteroidota bacterium]MDP4244040.1 hypothetical protein [Bacteroidota bacterium]MDP4287721.1 hypothetical protein [Bacteroidota bacterium]